MCPMVSTHTGLIATIRGYAEELGRLGVPSERSILYGSHQRGTAHKETERDNALFSVEKSVDTARRSW